MKNLYIFIMDVNGKLIKEVWEDVKITRDKGLIVTKRDAEYRLSHNSYRDKVNLDVVRQYSAWGTEYISFEVSEITQEIKQRLIRPFIDEYMKEIRMFKDKINELENAIKES